MAANTYTVSLTDGREVCFSYGVPVAAFVPELGLIKTRLYHSVTTSRHANAYVAGRNVTVLEPKAFTDAIKPVERGSR